MLNVEATTNMDSGYSKIITPRITSTLLWNFVLQFLPLILYQCVVEFSLSSPLLWIQNCINLIFCLSTWFYMIVLFVIVTFLALVLMQNINEIKPCFTTRIQKIIGSLNSNNTICAFMYFVISVTIALIYLTISKQNLRYQCKTIQDRQCINEKYLFLVLNSVWCSLYFNLTCNVLQDVVLYFSPIQQYKFLRVKTEIPKVIKQCFRRSIWPTLYFVVLYYWKGKYFLGITQKYFGVDNEVEPVTSITGFFNIYLFLQAWLFTCIFLLHILNLKITVEVHLSQRYHFTLSEPGGVVLTNALQCNQPYIQQLAFFDLYLISAKNSSLRSELFMLSNPGGHPHSWNAVLQLSLKTIQEFCQKLEATNITKLTENHSSPVSKHIQKNQAVKQPETRDTPYLSPSCKIRSLISSEVNAPISSYTRSQDKDFFTTKLQQIMTEIYNKPGINYLFGNIPEAQVNYMIVNSQPVIWATLSLSSLASVSLVEDQYGVVLKSLPLIINNIIKLKLAVDKVNKLALFGLNKKVQKPNSLDVCMLNSLKTAIRQSLYKIAITYSDYVNELPLSREDYACMQSFIAFRET